MLTPDKFFETVHGGRWPAVVCLQGDDDYLRRELRELLKSQGFSVQLKDLKRKGPESVDEDLSCSTSLFQSRSFVWLETQAEPNRWSEESKRIWARMVARADGDGLVLCVQVKGGDFQSRSATSKTGVELGSSFRFHVLESERKVWLDRMNRRRGTVLKKEQLAHLLGLDVDLLALDQLVELWTLGGDVWARIGVSYVPGNLPDKSRTDKSANPAYAWVDSFLDKTPSSGLKNLRRLIKEGQDPLPLMGLLAKTLRIWATLESGATPHGEAPFLVDKIRRQIASSKQNPSGRKRGAELLQAAGEIDVWLKSRPVDAEGLLVRLTTLPIF